MRILKEASEFSGDSIIVLGKNIEIGSGARQIQKRPDYLSESSRLNVYAASMLYKPGLVIVFATGDTAGVGIAEAEAMQRLFLSTTPEASKNDTHLELESWDTANNAFYLKPFVKRLGIRRPWLDTVSYHLTGAMILHERYGVPLEGGIPSDTLLLTHSDSNMRRRALNYRNSLRYRVEQLKELGRLGLLFTIDPHGDLVEKLTLGRKK